MMRLGHVAITVRDVDGTVEWLQQMFGFRKLWVEQETAIEPARLGLAVPEVRLEGVHLEGAPGVILEVHRYITPEGVPVPRRVCDPGISHIGIFTDDIQRDHERLRAAGIELAGPPVGIDHGDLAGQSWSPYFSGPEGIVFHLHHHPQV
jgi:catechol 2,3-dioxygenase-like lactoylglutathione lyase family enzyme